MDMQKRLGPAAFCEADADLATTLDNLDSAANYASWIFSLVRPYLHGAVLEVGAGHGTFTARFSDHAERVVAGDPSGRCVAELRERYAHNPRVSVYEGGVAEAAPEGPFQAAVLMNVLEHIEDDDDALRRLFEVLDTGGHLVLWVPAFELLYSDFDRRIGHFRRYRRAGLRAKLAGAGFEVVECRYVNMVGALAWLILARILRRTPTAAGPVAIYDKYFVPVLRRIEDRIRVPAGQSIFAVARKPDSTRIEES